MGFWAPSYTYLGVCHSFFLSAHSHYVNLPGKFNNLYVVLNELEDEFYNEQNGWKIFVHDWVDPPISPGIDPSKNSFTLDVGYSKEIRIHNIHVGLH